MYDLASDRKFKVLYNVHLTPLHAPQIDFLLTRHAQVNPPDKYGRTCLHMACAEGHVPIVRRLLAAKACCYSITCMRRRGIVLYVICLFYCA